MPKQEAATVTPDQISGPAPDRLVERLGQGHDWPPDLLAEEPCLVEAWVPAEHLQPAAR